MDRFHVDVDNVKVGVICVLDLEVEDNLCSDEEMYRRMSQCR